MSEWIRVYVKGQDEPTTVYTNGAAIDAIKNQLDQKYNQLKDFAAKAWGGLSPFDKAAIATAPVPVVGDITGLVADADMFINDPESRTLLNVGLSAMGLIPFVPALSTAKKVTKSSDLAADNSLVVRKDNMDAPEYDYDSPLAHSSPNEKLPEIKREGLFDGIFAQPGEKSSHVGEYQHVYVPRKNKIMDESDRDIDYEDAMTFLRSEYPDADNDLLDQIYDITMADENVWAKDTNPLQSYGFPDLGEASWEAQRIRGKYAGLRDFDAVAMSDEYGVSYLIPYTSKAKKIK